LSYCSDLVIRKRMPELSNSQVILTVQQQGKRNEHQPAHFLALDDRNLILYLVIRGTATIDDVFTDVIGHPTRVSTEAEFRAHSGINAAARYLCDSLKPLIVPLVKSCGYRMVVLGHSMGGGSGALLTAMLVLENVVPKESIRCFFFGGPAIADPELASFCSGLVTSIVHLDDIVPRMRPKAALLLFAEYREMGLDKQILEDLDTFSAFQVLKKFSAWVNLEESK
jgi:hypothetical protein